MKYSDKLGFTFYPQDWWSSDSFFDFDPFERYVYLECLFIMYRNNGYMKTQKTQFENRIRIPVSEDIWKKITAKFIETDEGFTSLTVNKRLKKATISRENGSLGGRPRKEETQKTQTDNLKRKRIESETERESERKGDFYADGSDAFEEIKSDELMVERLIRTVHHSGFKAATAVQVITAVRYFLTKESAKPEFFYRPRDEIKSHLVNWIAQNATKITTYG